LARSNGDPRHRIHRLCAVWVALLVLPLVAAATATPAAASPPQHPAQSARFSDLTELTPANVQGLLPLLSRTTAAKDDDQGSLLPRRSSAHGLQMESLAGVDLRLQRFLDERVHLQPAIENPGALQPTGALGREISKQELRAWDTISRRVVWSVTEALPLTARTLITAGGLVFYGTSDGWLKALDARTGRTLWTHRAEGRRLEQPFSYRGTDGHQYIAVHSLPRDPADGSQTVLVFALAH